MTRGRTHFPIAHELEKVTLTKLRGESTSMKKLLHGSSKAVSARRLMIPQSISCKLPGPGQRLSRPGGNCLCHQHFVLPSADFQALDSHGYDLSLPQL